MTTYEIVDVKWLGNLKWGIKETVPGHPPHICKLCETRKEAEAMLERYKAAYGQTDIRRAS